MHPENHVILLTGGTSGIGRALLRRFLQLGNSLIATSSKEENLAALKQEFPQVATIHCDLGDPQSVQALIQTCLEKHRDISMVINNAGIQYNYSWLQEPQAYSKMEEEIRVNLTSPLQISYGLLPLLKEKKEAAIINVSSVLALVPKQSAPVYCGTKAGLHIATKALRYQLENTSIKVFEILPPLVDTPMTAGRGQGKISPDDLVDEFMPRLRRDQFEVNIGKTKLLRTLLRLAPRVAHGILKKG